MEIEVKVVSLAVDPRFGNVLMMLRAVSEDKKGAILPMWVMMFEGYAIFTAIQKTKTNRPMTHDLFYSMLFQYGVRLEKVVIVDIKETVYYALMYVRKGDEVKTIDVRPSDAIALALRFEAPIYVEDSVFEKAKPAERTESQEEMYKRMLAAMDPERLPQA